MEQLANGHDHLMEFFQRRRYGEFTSIRIDMSCRSGGILLKSHVHKPRRGQRDTSRVYPFGKTCANPGRIKWTVDRERSADPASCERTLCKAIVAPTGDERGV